MDDPQVGTRPRLPDPYWRPGDDAAPAVPPARRSGNAGPLALMLVGVVAALALVAVVATVAAGAVDTVDDGAEAVAPPPGGVGEPIRVGDAPADVEAGDDGAVWTADRGSGTVTRIDPETGDTSSTTIGGEPTALVVGPERVWVWNYSSVLTPIGLDGRAGESLYLPADISSIAMDGDTVLFAQPTTGSVGRIDARTGAPQAPLRTGGRPDQIAVDGSRLTVLDSDGTTRSVDTGSGRSVDGPALPAGTSTIASAEGRRYALGAAGVSELAPAGAAPAPLRYGGLTGFDVGGDSAWVLDTAGVLHRATPDLAPLGETSGLGAGGDVAVGTDGRVWVLDTAAGTVRAVAPA